MIINKVVYGGPAADIPSHLSFGQFVLDYLRECEDGVALINGADGTELTRKQLLHQIVGLATGLKRLGFKKGDVVAICSENRAEILVSTVASLCCAATVTTINSSYTEDELHHVINISKPKYIFASPTTLKASFNYFKKYSFIENIIQYGAEALVDRNVLRYNDLVVQNVDVVAYEPDMVQGATDVALILYSSGTTGLPKGVMLTHVNFLYMAFLNRDKGSDTKTYLTIVPWYHGYGLMGTIKYIMTGKTMVYLIGFNPQIYLNALQKYKVEMLLLVPPILLFLIKSPIVKQYDVTSVRKILCAAAPLTAQTAQQVFERFPNCVGVLQAYGMTETSLSVTIDSEEDVSKNKLGSGGFPLPGVRMKVVDLQTGALLGPHERGEICVKTPGAMLGYAGDAAAGRDMLDAHGYLKTGDIGYYDHDGYFYIVDRLKELIKYKAHQVAPAEVESAVLQHAAVAECGVAGAPHPAAGELATAFVVLKPTHAAADRNALAQDIVQFVAQKLSHPKQLHGGVVIVDEIPKNPSGKILRRVLRDRLRTQSKL